VHTALASTSPIPSLRLFLVGGPPMTAGSLSGPPDHFHKPPCAGGCVAAATGAHPGIVPRLRDDTQHTQTHPHIVFVRACMRARVR
jgi:hypothetical protein